VEGAPAVGAPSLGRLDPDLLERVGQLQDVFGQRLLSRRVVELSGDRLELGDSRLPLPVLGESLPRVRGTCLAGSERCAASG